MNNQETVWDVFAQIIKQTDQTIKDLNYGGCGIFAEQLHKFLVKNKIKHEIVVFTDNSQYEIDNSTDGLGVNKAHIVVKLYNDLYVDSTGISLKKAKMCGNRYEAVLKPKQLRSWNNTALGWNPHFDRSQIPVIKQIFKQTTKQL